MMTNILTFPKMPQEATLVLGLGIKMDYSM
jgi:hypothetical protein